MNTLFHSIHLADMAIYRFLAGFAGNWILDSLAGKMEANYLFQGGIFLAAYWYVWFRPGQDLDNRRRSVIAVLTGTLLALIAERVVSVIVPFRVRPMFDPSVGHPAYSITLSPNFEAWSAFPSGHATYFFALAFGLAYLLRRFTIPIMLYTAGWICLPRMYLGVHYASDIVAGAAIGIGTVWCSLRNEWLHSVVAGRALAWMETKPDWFYSAAFLVSFEMAFMFDDIRRVGHTVLHAAGLVSYYGLPRLAFTASSACLVLIAAFFLRRLYRRNRYRLSVPSVADYGSTVTPIRGPRRS
jgi:membrane-associated phospholipid phosphatase